MLNNSVFKSRSVLVICIAVLAVVTGLASGWGSPQANENVNNNSDIPAPIVVPPAIVAMAKSCADEPMRGKVYYYCDCAAGAAGNCVAGNDANEGTSPSAPRRTLANATARISSFTGNTNHTIALCKGGAFNSVATYGESINRSGCTAGTDCDDIRDYASPAFTSSAAPLVTEPISNVSIFSFMGNHGGVRIMNLALKDTTGSHASQAMFAAYNAHDITMCNNTMNDFGIAIQLAGDKTVTPSTNIHIKGNTITGSSNIAVLGAASNSEVSYNYFERNGGTSIFNHTIYWSGHIPMTNVQIVGNYVHNTYSPTCNGVVIVGHGEMDYFNVTDNIVNIDSSVAAAGCFGIGFGSAPAYPEANYFRHATFSRNTIINAGALSMAIANAPGALVEDNLIISDYAYSATPGVSQWPIVGFSLATAPSRTTPYVDDPNTAMTIRNNTVWFGPHVLGGAVGMNTGVEGIGHIFANNTVTYSAATAARTVGCFGHNLPATSFAFMNNNHCYSAAGATWRVTVDTNGQIIKDSTAMSLSAWKTNSSAQGWDSASVGGTPNFVKATTSTDFDFHPNANPALPLSPLLGKGDPAKVPKYDLTGSSEFTNPPAIGAYK